MGLTPLVSWKGVSVPLKAENVSSEAEFTLNVDAMFPETATMLAEVSGGQDKFILATVLHDSKEREVAHSETAGLKS